jgi:hypothetical protein
VIRDEQKKKSSFEPLMMGVKRQVEPVSGETVSGLDVVLDIPLTRNVPLRLDNPPLVHPGTQQPTETRFRVTLDFGGDGFWMVTDQTETTKLNWTLPDQPASLSGSLDDVTYMFLVEITGETAESGTRANKVKVLDTDRLFSFQDGAWKVVKSGIPTDIYGVFSATDGEHWAVGADGLVAHSKSGGWFPQYSPTPNDLFGLWGTDTNELFAVGAGGTVLHFNGVIWSEESSPTEQDLLAVWGTTKDNMVAVGQNIALRRTALGWETIEDHPDTTIRAVWGTDGSEFIAVGDGGKLWRYKTSWKEEVIDNTGVALRAVSGAQDMLWVVGDSGTVLQWTQQDGWTQHDVPTTEQLNSVYALENGHVFAAGNRGVLLHYDGLGWSLEKAPKYGGDLQTVWASDDAGIAAYAAGTQVIRIGPMLSFPIINDPVGKPNGFSTFNYHLDWTALPSAEPTFNFIEMIYQGSFPLWWTVVKADVTEVNFPPLAEIKGYSPLPPGAVVAMVVNRVLKPGASVDNFDFWDTWDKGSWKSWSKDTVGFVTEF